MYKTEQLEKNTKFQKSKTINYDILLQNLEFKYKMFD